MKHIVAFTGAGISKASGIPTFEEVPGIRDCLTREYFKRNPGDFYENARQLYDRIKHAEPNPAHLTLAKYKIPVITMNVDGLHRKAGTAELVEIHGNLDWVYCPKCRKTEKFGIVEKRIHCLDCHQVLEPQVILYGDEILEFPRAIELVNTAEVLLVIGTSFYTSTSGFVVDYARSRGCIVEVINQCAEQKVAEFLEKHVS